MMLTVSRLCRIDDKMINECGAVERMRIFKGNKILRGDTWIAVETYRVMRCYGPHFAKTFSS
jgi:hypothetical protein